jgi:hypothetical protein
VLLAVLLAVIAYKLVGSRFGTVGRQGISVSFRQNLSKSIQVPNI